MNGLSEIPMSEEANLVDEDSLKATIPVVWQILKSILFASTLILQELMSRVAESPALCDSESRSDLDGPSKAEFTNFNRWPYDSF